MTENVIIHDVDRAQYRADLDLLSATHAPVLSRENGLWAVELQLLDLADERAPTYAVRVDVDPLYADPVERIEVLSREVSPELRDAIRRFVVSRECVESMRAEIARAIESAEEAAV